MKHMDGQEVLRPVKILHWHLLIIKKHFEAKRIRNLPFKNTHLLPPRKQRSSPFSVVRNLQPVTEGLHLFFMSLAAHDTFIENNPNTQWNQSPSCVGGPWRFALN